MTEVTQAGTTTYGYDLANRLTSVNGVTYTWDAKGNLLSDGEWTYTYAHANRLSSAVRGPSSFSFAYNGLGDRLRQTVNGSPTNYTVDLAAGLTQVLSDGTNAYLYGVTRIGEEQPGGWQYHLGDALGSVRQLVGASGAVTLAQSYEPYGSVLNAIGSASTIFQFTGEHVDRTGLAYLRARYYAPHLGQWIQPDPAVPNPRIPADWNHYVYVGDNPINFIDPSGEFKCEPMPKCQDWLIHALVQLDVSAGPFGDIVLGAFERLDEGRGEDTLYIDFFTGTDQVPGPGISLVNYRIFLPRAYMNDSIPPPPRRIAVLTHEVVHQIQSFRERTSTWGEAQAYIFQGKILEELGESPPGFISDAMRAAYDLGSSGFTTTDRKNLREVKRILVDNSTGSTRVVYGIEPLLPWEIVDRCGP